MINALALLLLSNINGATAVKTSHDHPQVSAVHISQKLSLGADKDVRHVDTKDTKDAKIGFNSSMTANSSEDSVQQFQTPSKDVTVNMNNHLNVQYSGLFTIGQQELPMIYDTGSFEVLVLSTMCRSCRKSLEMYDSTNSSSYRGAESVIANHEFVSGNVVTAEGFDTLHLGPKDSPVIAKDMTIWQVTRHELAFWKTGNAIFSGIVGLSHVKTIPDGFSGDSMQPKSMLEEMHLDDFALCYQRGGGTPPGVLKFGPTVSGMSKDPGFQTVDVSGDSHWATKLSKFKVSMSGSGANIDNIDTSGMCKPSCGALIDSGTSLLTFPRSASHITEALKAKVKSDCSNLDELPTLYFELAGAEVILPPRAYIFKVKNEEGGHHCKGAFMKVDRESQFGEVFILGMPFLRYYFTVFDRANKKVHIARSTEDCKVAKSMSLLSSNQSGLSGRLGLGLTEADFNEPTEADLDAVIAPEWLLGPGEKVWL